MNKVADLPEHALKDDSRVDPHLLASFAAVGIDVPAPKLPLDAESPREEKIALYTMIELMYKDGMNRIVDGLPLIENVVNSSVSINGQDGNDITLYIHTPTTHNSESDSIPCVYHIHGGGMCILEAQYAYYTRWRTELSSQGVIVIGVEYRNAAGRLGNHPFPAGLNDCMSGLQWINENKLKLGISKVIIHGESGGANLSLALTLLRKGHDPLLRGYLQTVHIYRTYIMAVKSQSA